MDRLHALVLYLGKTVFQATEIVQRQGRMAA